MPSMQALLGREGPLSKSLSGYEDRPGQASMAEAVERALREERIVLCEAGTGTGKTLAYLIPAILSQRKVVISTATRALQEQIVFKDLPLIAECFGLRPRVALMKGISNYLCRRRFGAFLESPAASLPQHQRSLKVVEAWVKSSERGDLGELEELGEEDPIRREIDSSSETRVGSACPHFDECFVTLMKREAEQAQIVVVNHHLFFADLALRGPHPARVLPDYEAVIFDEAHQIEDVATDFFSVRVSSARIERLLGDVGRALSLASPDGPLYDGGAQRRLLDEARAATSALFRSLLELGGRGEGRVSLDPDVWLGARQALRFRLDSALEDVSALVASVAVENRNKRARRGAAEALVVAERRTELLREQLAQVADGGRGRVVWLQTGPGSPSVSSSLVDVSAVVRERVFERVPSVVLTSATLATGAASADGQSPFSYLRTRLGISDDLPRIEELVVSSPFEFQEQALLYTPTDLPAPGRPEFWEAAAARAADLIQITGGGCFVLSTSLRAMREIHKRLVTRLGPGSVMLQGDAPKATLIARFRAAEGAVLVATMSFWEGVDVPGRALRLVVLEKIPFAVPTDPIVEARSRAIEEAGDNAFMRLHVPAAALTLKQGFGRLIRSKKDVGIVALLDPRVHARGYGGRLLAALPPARRTSSLEEVRAFWSEKEARAPVAS